MQASALPHILHAPVDEHPQEILKINFLRISSHLSEAVAAPEEQSRHGPLHTLRSGLSLKL